MLWNLTVVICFDNTVLKITCRIGTFDIWGGYAYINHLGLIVRFSLNLETSELPPVTAFGELCSNLVGPGNCYINSEQQIAYFGHFELLWAGNLGLGRPTTVRLLTVPNSVACWFVVDPLCQVISHLLYVIKLRNKVETTK